MLFSLSTATIYDLLIHFEQDIQGHISVVYDSWSSRRRRPFSSYSIQFVHSFPDDPYKWSLRSHLIGFKHTVGRHSGTMVGKQLASIIDEFDFGHKVHSVVHARHHYLLYFSSAG